ncbi:MAG: hypothetical protein ABIH99_02140 [Candidatus Micrarchaeota archaeon]
MEIKQKPREEVKKQAPSIKISAETLAAARVAVKHGASASELLSEARASALTAEVKKIQLALEALA